MDCVPTQFKFENFQRNHSGGLEKKLYFSSTTADNNLLAVDKIIDRSDMAKILTRVH